MSWIRKLISRPRDPPSEDTEAAGPSDADAEPQSPRRSGESTLEHGLLQPTTRMTGHQFIYIFVLDGIGAMILSGGINFAVAYAMYATLDTAKNPIRLFQLPNTLAGDAGVTMIIQCLITWLVEYLLVNRDLRKGTVAPAAFLPEPTGRLARWLFLLPVDGSALPPFPSIFDHVLRAMLVALASFVVLWGPSVGILTAVGTRSGGDWVFEGTWAPQVFKLVLGGVLALLTTPCFAIFWLAREGWSATEVARDEGREALGP